MPLKKPAIDYKQLPFEVHFSNLDTVSYEFYYEATKSGRPPKVFKFIEKQDGEAQDVTFLCEEPPEGALAYLMSGQLSEYVPDWLSLVREGDSEPTSAEAYTCSIKRGELVLGDSVDQYDYEASGECITYYYARHYSPDYFILDAKKSRVMVNAEGFKLGKDGSPVGAKPIVQFSEDELADCQPAELEEVDIRQQLAKLATCTST